MLERVKSLKDLVVLNDEAHHVHDEDLQWSQSLLAIHRALPKGLALGSTSPPRPRTRTGCTSPGPSATTRSPRRWRTASSRRR